MVVVERRVRRLVRDRLLEEATGTVVHRAGGEIGPSLASVNEDVVVAAAERLLAAMDPHRLDVGTQGARQLADDLGVPAGLRQRVELVELRVHDHLDRAAVAERHVDYVRVDRDRVVDAAVEHLPLADTAVVRAGEGRRVGRGDDVGIDEHRARERGVGLGARRRCCGERGHRDGAGRERGEDPHAAESPGHILSVLNTGSITPELACAPLSSKLWSSQHFCQQ
jgi:hypothetical protein